MDKEAIEKIAKIIGIGGLCEPADRMCDEKCGECDDAIGIVGQIFEIMGKLGYRKPIGKPRLLNEEEICELIDAEPLAGLNAGYYSLSENIAQAQLDICIKHYEGE